MILNTTVCLVEQKNTSQWQNYWQDWQNYCTQGRDDPWEKVWKVTRLGSLNFQ